MFGTKVILNDGQDRSCISEGIIISDRCSKYGEFWTVLWTSGELCGSPLDFIPKRGLKTHSNNCGIGVYIAK